MEREDFCPPQLHFTSLSQVFLLPSLLAAALSSSLPSLAPAMVPKRYHLFNSRKQSSSFSSILINWINMSVMHQSWHNMSAGDTQPEVRRRVGDSRMEWELPHSASVLFYPGPAQFTPRFISPNCRHMERGSLLDYFLPSELRGKRMAHLQDDS